MKQIVKFFDDERRRSCLEWLFDDTVIQAPAKSKKKRESMVDAFDSVLAD